MVSRCFQVLIQNHWKPQKDFTELWIRFRGCTTMLMLFGDMMNNKYCYWPGWGGMTQYLLETGAWTVVRLVECNGRVSHFHLLRVREDGMDALFIQTRKELNPLHSFQKTTGEMYFPYGSRLATKMEWINMKCGKRGESMLLHQGKWGGEDRLKTGIFH